MGVKLGVSHSKGRTQTDSRALRRISEYKKDEVTGSWRKLYNEGFHNLYSSPNIIIRMIKSVRMI
jgi:hypothetical protein